MLEDVIERYGLKARQDARAKKKTQKDFKTVSSKHFYLQNIFNNSMIQFFLSYTRQMQKILHFLRGIVSHVDIAF